MSNRGPQRFDIHLTRLALILLLASGSFGQAVYVPNYTTSNVSGYIVDPATGSLAAVPGLPVKAGTSPIQALIHPSGKFLYILNSGSRDITLYSISAPSGALAILGCPHCEAASPSGMVFDPTGQVLFVSNLDPGSVTPYRVDPATGQLTIGVAASTGRDSRPVQPAVDPTGRYLYVANSNTGQVAGFQINGASLTSLPGSPFPAGSGPSSVAASRFAVFVTNRNSGDVSIYQIASGGTLTAVGLPVPTGASPTSIAVDPSGNHVYVTNQAYVLAFNTTPNGLYALTYLRAYNAGSIPSYVTVDPDGRFVYAVNTASNDVSGFEISASGTLIPAGAASTTGTSGSGMLTVQHIGDQTAILLDAGYPAPASASFGMPVTLKGFIRNKSNPGNVPRGSVTVSVNGSPVVNGTVALDPSGSFNLIFNASTQYLPVGISIIQVAYRPATGFEAPAPLRSSYSVSKAAPSFVMTPPLNPIATQPVSIGVASSQTGGRYPTGAVNLTIDGLVTAAVLTNGGVVVSHTPSTGTHVVTLQYGGDAYFSASTAGPITFLAKNSTSTIVTSSPTSVVYGQAAVFVAVVNAGGTAVGGSVDFFEDGTRINSSPIPIAAGQAQFGPHTLRSGGVRAITAQFSGDAMNLPSSNAGAPLLMTVNRASVQISSPVLSGAAVYGPLNFAVTVAPAPPSNGIPGGMVSLTDGGSSVASAPIVNGTAKFVVSLSAANHELTAVYAGDSNYLPGTSASASLAIAKATPSLTVTGTPASIASGQPATITAMLTGSSPVAGTVEFRDADAGFASNPVTVVGGQAQFTYLPRTAGTHRISTFFSSDGNWNDVNSSGTPFVLTVQQAATSIGAITKAGSTTFGQPITFNMAVSPVPPGSGTPTGTVTFRDDANILGFAALAAGSASMTSFMLAAGNHAITASYSGDRDFAASTSPALPILVDKASTVTILSVSQTQTATVLLAKVFGPNVGVPQGSVQFSDGFKLLGTAVLSGGEGEASATLALGPVAGEITATYSGSSNLSASTSAAINVSALPKLATALTITLDRNPAMPGQPVTCTLNFTWTGATAPMGTIQLYDGANQIASVQAASRVVFTAGFAAGSHTLSAVYSGDGTYESSTARLGLVVNRNAASFVAYSSVENVDFGDAVILTVRMVGPSSNVAPTGKVEFVEGTKLFGSTNWQGGVANFVLPILEPGTHQINALYGGDANWDSSSSNAVTITVKKAATVVEITAAREPDRHGEVLLTANLQGKTPGAVAPSGSIAFVDVVTNQVLATAPLTAGGATAIVPAEIGARTIIAIYPGDGRFLDSSSASRTQFSVLNGASFRNMVLAPGQIATVFSPDLSTETLAAEVLPLPTKLNGVSVTLLDSTTMSHRASLFHVSPSQLSFLVPAEIAIGPATIRIQLPGGVILSAATTIGLVSPGIFAANANGQGVASAQIVRVHPDETQDPPENIAIYDSAARQWIATPIPRGSPADRLYLIIYATGIRNHSTGLTVSINGQLLPALYAGKQAIHPGLDQVNVFLPDDLLTPGTAIVSLTTEGGVSNAVSLLFQ